MIGRYLVGSAAHRSRIECHLRLGALVAFMLAMAQNADAQGEHVGRVEGVVFDSVHTRAIVGAHVVAVGTGSRAEVRSDATTDSIGRYRIDSLPLGRYVVGFENALLDSLEVTLSPREVTVGPGQVATLDLALPSATKLRAAVCPGVALASETGVIFGHVVSAETESPLVGVVLAMAWRELGVDHTTLRPISGEHTESVVTDDGGWYRMCGVPTGTWVSMQLQHEDRVGPVLRTRVDDTLGIAIRHLSFSTVSARRSDETSDGAASTPLSGTATLTGIVRGPGGLPVPAAEVRVRGTLATGQTDASGAYSFKALPAGTQELEVRHVGYAMAETSVELRSGATTTSNVRLYRIVSLDSVRVLPAPGGSTPGDLPRPRRDREAARLAGERHHREDPRLQDRAGGLPHVCAGQPRRVVLRQGLQSEHRHRRREHQRRA